VPFLAAELRPAASHVISSVIVLGVIDFAGASIAENSESEVETEPHIFG
jgi:hypothetical protein